MSQKKHELLQNELVDAIETNYDKIKPHMSKIVLVSTAIVLGVLAIVLWNYTQRMTAENQWADFLYSTQLAEIRGMEDVAKTFPDTAAGQYALIRVADYDYNRGAANIVSNRDDFTDKVKKAIERYDALASRAKVDPFVKRRAVFGLGHSYESLGEFEKARQNYQQLIDSAPDDPITILARKGIKRLDADGVVGIYEKFSQWQPPAVAPEANPLVPKQPNISFPSAASTDPASDPAPVVEEPADVTPEPGVASDPTDGGGEIKADDSDENTDAQKADDGDSNDGQ